MFYWFKSAKAVALGDELAKMVSVLLPRDGAANQSKYNSKLNYAKEKLGKRLHTFLQCESLNFYTTAKLINTFKWILKDEGYPTALIDDLGMWILLEARKRKD